MDCFDRDREAEKLWSLFKKGRNGLMLARRPDAKTGTSYGGSKSILTLWRRNPAIVMLEHKERPRS